MIYNSGWEVRVGKERALDQQVPSAYIAILKVGLLFDSQLQSHSNLSCLQLGLLKISTNSRWSVSCMPICVKTQLQLL